MIDTTKEIKKSLQKLGKDYKAKVDLLHNQYQNKDCYILSCGPSLNQYSQEFLNEYLKDKLVLSIKSAYNRHREVTDFHFFNCCNLPKPYTKPYHYDYDNTIAIASSNFPEGYRWSPVQKYDIFFRIPEFNHQTNIDKDFLCNSLDYNKYLLLNQFERCLGPGIMYETVLYTAIHLGVKNINVLGWDVSGFNEHFYDRSTEVYNPGSCIPWESNALIESSHSLYQWMQSIDVNLNLVSKQSKLSADIPRIDLC